MAECEVVLQLPADLIERIDHLAARLGCSRGALIARVLPVGVRDAERDQDAVEALENIFADEPTAREQTAARSVEYARTLLEGAGGGLTIEQVQDVVGDGSLQRIQDAIASRRLLAVELEGVQLFPAFQFDGNRIVDGVGEVLTAVPNTNPWAILQFFVAGDEGLGEDLPMNLVKGSPDDIARAARFARTMDAGEPLLDPTTFHDDVDFGPLVGNEEW